MNPKEQNSQNIRELMYGIMVLLDTAEEEAKKLEGTVLEDTKYDINYAKQNVKEIYDKLDSVTLN